MAKGCATKQIRFKTKRGRTISFKGRHGPDCSPRRRSHKTPAAFRPWAAAAKKCARRGKIGSKAQVACMKAQVRGK